MRNNTKIEADVGEKKRGILEEIVGIGRKNRQLGLYLFVLYWYTHYRDGVELKRLWRFYNNISTHIVHENTVRKQLKLLENKGLIEIRNNKIYPKIFDLDAITDSFDIERSRVSKRGALQYLRKSIRWKLYQREIDVEIPRNLDYYVRRVLDTTIKLVRESKQLEALDLIAHTLLPLRENGVLWLWRKDEFIYYEPKTKPSLHVARFPALAKALRKLGFKEGIMIDHTRGHKYVKELIRKIFGKGNLSWSWSRSVFYGLKKLGLAGEGNEYIVELLYENGVIKLLLRDNYGNILEVFEKKYREKLPEPLSKRTYYKSVVIGKQHVKEENEESYFSRWL